MVIKYIYNFIENFKEFFIPHTNYENIYNDKLDFYAEIFSDC